MAKAAEKSEGGGGGQVADGGVPMKPRSGSETRKRTKALLIRLTEAERIEVEEASRKAGLTAGSYARQQMLKASPPRSVRRPPIEREIAAQLLGQVGRVGGNLHQLVRHLNFGREVEQARLMAVIDALEQLKGEIIDALGRKGDRHGSGRIAKAEAEPEPERQVA